MLSNYSRRNSLCESAVLRSPLRNFTPLLYILHRLIPRCVTRSFSRLRSISQRQLKDYDALPFERLHLMFCKYILGVNKSTSNTSVRRELGRLPLILSSFIIIIKYWSHILSKPNDSLLFQTYLTEKENNTEWIKSLQLILKICDLESYWETQTPVTEQAIIKQVKVRLRENFQRHYNSTAQSNTSVTYDNPHGPSKYLSYRLPIYTKRLIAKLRLQSNRLEIIRGRYSRPSVPKPDRICKSCNLEVYDEVHFITKCPTLADIRSELFSKIEQMNPHFSNLSNSNKTILLLNPDNEDIAKILGAFIQKAKKITQF